ncbi:hypothetical protein FF38_06664 [Lucilia cuprina]|uniref:Uncharacterized protein n=1 Tax=Lucilia cuprina TaxID=7375 RepID=A0A0L0CFU4_LUCCU|nr:hypothetical protein FF38_06664 [Lucilia cuprina]
MSCLKTNKTKPQIVIVALTTDKTARPIVNTYNIIIISKTTNRRQARGTAGYNFDEKFETTPTLRQMTCVHLDFHEIQNKHTYWGWYAGSTCMRGIRRSRPTLPIFNTKQTSAIENIYANSKCLARPVWSLSLLTIAIKVECIEATPAVFIIVIHKGVYAGVTVFLWVEVYAFSKVLLFISLPFENLCSGMKI